MKSKPKLLLCSNWYSWKNLNYDSADAYRIFKSNHPLSSDFFYAMFNKCCRVKYDAGIKSYRYGNVINFVGIVNKKYERIVSKIFKIFDYTCPINSWNRPTGKLAAYKNFVVRAIGIKSDTIFDINGKYNKKLLDAMLDEKNINSYLAMLELDKMSSGM